MQGLNNCYKTKKSISFVHFMINQYCLKKSNLLLGTLFLLLLYSCLVSLAYYYYYRLVIYIVLYFYFEH